MLDVVCFSSGGAGWWGSWGSQFIADVRNKVLCTDKLTVIRNQQDCLSLSLQTFAQVRRMNRHF